jgi:hypothetical protein
MLADACDALVLAHRPLDVTSVPSTRPLFVCAEMLLDLADIEPKCLRLWRTRAALQRKGALVATLAQFLEAPDIAWLESTAAYIAHNWYLADDRDRSLYRDVSLGSCCEYDLKAKSIRLLKFALTCRRMLSRYPGRPVYSDYAADAPEARLLAALGVDARPLAERAAERLDPAVAPVRSSRRSITQIFDQRGRAVGLTLARVLSAFVGRRQPVVLPTVVVRPSQQTMAMLERWALRRPRRVHMSIWMSHLIFPRRLVGLLRAGATLVAAVSSHGPENPADLETAMDGWSSDARTTLNIAELTGFPLQDTFDALFARVADREFPRYAAIVDHAYEALEHPPAAGLVLPNDCQGPMRAWALVAKRTGTLSIIVQHGHLDYVEDGDHFVGDFSAFWSQMVCDQYESLGLEPERMLVTGSPNADISVAHRDQPLASTRPTKTRVLVITTGNPGVQAYVEETWLTDYVVRVLADLCDGTQEYDVSLRLHPGESLALYRQLIAPWIDQLVAIGDRGSLGECLSRADVVVSPPSTVVLEARARGIPVVLLPIASVDGRCTNLRDVEGVLALEPHESVKDGVRRIKGGERPAAHPQVSLADYLGPADAGAGLRLLEAVEAVTLRQAPRAALIE